MFRPLIVFLLLLAGAAAAQTGPVVRFAGPVNQDGCPFCCEFSCQASPTPTPEFDGQGRRVFRRASGHFMLVVEAGLGSSARQVGSEGVYSGNTVQSITHASGQPSLMVMTDRNLGNGSPQVDCRTEPLGGVQGFAALDFGAGGSVTTALVDMACRFEFASSAMFACTRDRWGNFAFLDASTTRQFCTQVSTVNEFPEGATTVAVQLRDVNGNLGPRHEFVVVVDGSVAAPATPTATPTRTPTPIPAEIAGAIRYYANTRPVPSATVRLTGSTTRTVTTQSTGAYLHANLTGGTMTNEPRKVGDFGSPSAISALDASHVLQTLTGTRTLDARQRLACDVTGNGSLSSLDAAHILQRVVGLLPRFSAATRCDSDWVFEPVAAAGGGRRLITPLLSSSSCRRGAIAYEPLAGAQSAQDFVAMLFGDCTGNWQPAGAALRAGALAGAPDVRLRASRRTADGKIRVVIAVEASAPFSAVDLTIALGPGLRAESVRPLRGAGDALMVSNLTDPTRPRIALASPAPLPPGAILVVDLAAAEGAGPDARLLRALVDDEPAIATTRASRVAS